MENIEQSQIEHNKKIKKQKVKNVAKKNITRIVALIIALAMVFALSATLIFYLRYYAGQI